MGRDELSRLGDDDLCAAAAVERFVNTFGIVAKIVVITGISFVVELAFLAQLGAFDEFRKKLVISREFVRIQFRIVKLLTLKLARI